MRSMWSVGAFLVVVAGINPIGWAGQQERATAALDSALRRAQQVPAEIDVGYRFRLDSGDGPSATQEYPLQLVGHQGKAYFVASTTPTAKLFVSDRALCTYDVDRWRCAQVPATQFDQSLKQRHMNLYPPTAMYLLGELVNRQRAATFITALGERTVAQRPCVAYRIAIDTNKLSREALANYLYAHFDSAAVTAAIAGATAEVCFDRETGQALAYENEIVVEQPVTAGSSGPAWKSARGGFEATRVSTSAPTVEAFYQLPKE